MKIATKVAIRYQGQVQDWHVYDVGNDDRICVHGGPIDWYYDEEAGDEVAIFGWEAVFYRKGHDPRTLLDTDDEYDSEDAVMKKLGYKVASYQISELPRWNNRRRNVWGVLEGGSILD